MSQVSCDTLPKIAPHVSYAVVTVKDYGKGQSRMGISSKLRWPFSQIQKKGGLSLTSMVGATSATQVSAMHRLTALPR
jgi:hypothetical protein